MNKGGATGSVTQFRSGTAYRQNGDGSVARVNPKPALGKANAKAYKKLRRMAREYAAKHAAELAKISPA